MSKAVAHPLRLLLLTLLLGGLDNSVALAQWYQTYDDALEAVRRSDWAVAEQRLKQAKREAEAAKKQPGRNVLRYGSLRLPFIPDFYLGQTYVNLASQTTDETTKKKYYEDALQAFALATKTGQVRDQDPERAPLLSASAVARTGIPGGSGPDVKGSGAGTPVDAPPADPDRLARQEIQTLVDRGDQALAAQNWDTALTTFQEAARRLDAVPSLKAEFAAVPARMAEAALGRDMTTALQHLKDGRFGPAVEVLDRAMRAAGGASVTSPATRALVAVLPRRLAEARVGQALTLADTAMKERRWSSARDAYESARRQGESMDWTSARARELFTQAPSRLKEASLNAALEQKRFVDALAIDRGSQAALEGQYGVASTAYNGGHWQDAVTAFGALLKYAPEYRDAAERKTAAEMQVELGLALATPETDVAEARRHYERVLTLQKSILGALQASPVVIGPAERASDSLRRIDARTALAKARTRYQDGQWDEARTSVNLVLRVLPDDPEARAMLALLNNTALEKEINDLSKRATEALARGDLSEAAEAAKSLSTRVPDNQVAASVLAQVATIQQTRQRWYRAFAVTLGIAAIGPALLVSPRRRARFFATIGRPLSALRLYERVLSSDPSDGQTLSRAAGLAMKHRINAPLDRHFDAYVRARPADAAVTRIAADYFWANGARKRAAELYEHVLRETTEPLPTLAYDRLGEWYQAEDAGGPAVAVLETARQRDPSNAGLVRLLASQYANADRTDARALDVYRAASQVDSDDARLGLLYARALLAHGDLRAAIEQAERAAGLKTNDESALDVLVDAYQRAGRDAVAAAVGNLEQLRLSPVSLLVVAERLADAVPAVRPRLTDIYHRQEKASGDPVVRSLFRAHRHLDVGECEASGAALDEAYAAPHASPLVLRALIRAHRRYFDSCSQTGRRVNPALLARVAQLHAEGQWWLEAVRAWQQIVSVPEWNRTSMEAIQDIVDSLPLVEVVEAYFGTAGWEVGQRGTTRPGFTDRFVTPGPTVHADLSSLFQNTQVFCASAVVTVDDVVAVKREVLDRRNDAEHRAAFLIATQAIRHDVYALIYAFMTEEPAVTIIPLELRAVREAIVESRTHIHLERMLHQWLGHTDIYETHNPVSNAATFFGRGQFINQLVLKISRGENFGIFGLRKIGKTSLVYRLRELSRDHLVAYVDLQGVASRRSDEVYLRLVESLMRDMRIKHPDIAVPTLRLNALGGDRSGVVASDFHTDLLAIRAAFEASGRPLPHVLLLLDEIELMIPADGSPGFEGHQDFFRHVRGLYQQEHFVVSAVVGASPTVCRLAKWSGRDNPVFQFYDEIFLAPLDRPECDQMVQGLGELMGVRYDQESLGEIYQQTAGHPYVARQLCSRLVKTFPDRPLQVRLAMVATAVNEYLAQRGDYFAGILEGYLDEVARRIVETVAKAGEDGESRGQILAQTKDLDAGRHVADQALGDLELVALLTRAGEQYKLSIPLFRRWLRRSWLDVE